MQYLHTGNTVILSCNAPRIKPVMVPSTRPAANDARMALASKQVPDTVTAELNKLRRENLVLLKEAAVAKTERADYIQKSNRVHSLLTNRIDDLEAEVQHLKDEASAISDDNMVDAFLNNQNAMLPELGDPGEPVPAQQVVPTDGAIMEL
jgi:Mn-dependent DtxR family transcriptional regulator